MNGISEWHIPLSGIFQGHFPLREKNIDGRENDPIYSILATKNALGNPQFIPVGSICSFYFFQSIDLKKKKFK